MSISLWKPEPNLIIHQALGKACEEASELAGILARCLIQGLNESEPVTGKPNHQALFEEIADLDAAVQWLRELVGDEYDEARADRKLNGFRRWQRMLEDDASTPDANPRLSGAALRAQYEKDLTRIIDEWERRREVCLADPEAKARFLILRSFDLSLATAPEASE